MKLTETKTTKVKMIVVSFFDFSLVSSGFALLVLFIHAISFFDDSKRLYVPRIVFRFERVFLSLCLFECVFMLGLTKGSCGRSVSLLSNQQFSQKITNHQIILSIWFVYTILSNQYRLMLCLIIFDSLTYLYEKNWVYLKTGLDV